MQVTDPQGGGDVGVEFEFEFEELVGELVDLADPDG